MATEQMIQDLVGRILSIDEELKLLREEKRDLLNDYKDKIDLKLFKAALRIAKIKQKLDTTSDATLDNMVQNVESKLTV